MLEGNTLPIVFIRYNPHTFTVAGKKAPIKEQDRHNTLLNTINALNIIKPLSVVYLFYDRDEDNRPLIMEDIEYNNMIKESYLDLE
jgi:hypothetical protein